MHHFVSTQRHQRVSIRLDRLESSQVNSFLPTRSIQISLDWFVINPPEPSKEAILLTTLIPVSLFSSQLPERVTPQVLDLLQHSLKQLTSQLAQSSEMATGAGGGQPSVLSTLPKNLPLDFVKTITDQFSKERILGTGAFGTVYKGIMPDGQIITVKKLAENSPIARDKAFANEVQNIMALHHENVVKLVGYCHEGQKKVVLNNGRYIVADIVESLLCHEYVPKGSLQKNLFEADSKMNWNTRFNIIKGICNGLYFVHAIPIIHMDLKPENILLDDNMVPKIADFGLSRLFGQEQTRMNTQNVVGSYGYIAPEYLYRGEISTKSDIYSLGLLILETTTGEKNCPGKEPSAVEFIKNVRENWKEQRIASVYPSLDADCLQQVKKCIEIGLECVEIDRLKRPSIETILDKLNGRCASIRN